MRTLIDTRKFSERVTFNYKRLQNYQDDLINFISKLDFPTEQENILLEKYRDIIEDLNRIKFSVLSLLDTAEVKE
jgi:hypothetical protein